MSAGQRLPTQAGAREGGRPSVKLLLVDDRRENLLLLESVLARPDRELFLAGSGNDALKLLLAHDFAVVLLDVQMPDMDGYETAQLMRGHERCRTVPILFLTAGDRDEANTFRGYDVGAVDFIYKPINTHILASKVDVFVELHRKSEEVQLLNGALERAQAALEDKVADLENLNRTLSHDLGAPLRSINAFAQILAESYTGRLDAEADSHLQRIIGASRRMQVMLDDLFRLLRLGTLTEAFQDVDLGAVLAATLEDLGADIDAAGAMVTIQTPLPTVRGHAGLLGQIFQNLIGNALKFRGDDPTRVQIGVERARDMWRLRVRDNGTGIDPSQRERVFGVFQRLVGRSVPGSGVGLSLVKKAVEKHGGTIWIAANDDGGPGTTFYFTLPA